MGQTSLAAPQLLHSNPDPQTSADRRRLPHLAFTSNAHRPVHTRTACRVSSNALTSVDIHEKYFSPQVTPAEPPSLKTEWLAPETRAHHLLQEVMLRDDGKMMSDAIATATATATTAAAPAVRM